VPDTFCRRQARYFGSLIVAVRAMNRRDAANGEGPLMASVGMILVLQLTSKIWLTKKTLSFSINRRALAGAGVEHLDRKTLGRSEGWKRAVASF
jgi:hypothetical protein